MRDAVAAWKLAAAGLAALALWAGTGAQAHAQDGALLAVQAPESVEVSEEPVQVDVFVENSPGLGGFQFVVTYDPDLFDYDRSERGPFLGSTGRELICNDPQPDTGAVRFACGSLGAEPAGPEGSGVLYSVYLRPKATGETTIGLSRALLATIEGNPITSTTADAPVVVEDPGSGISWLLWGPIAVVAAVVLIAIAGFVVMAVRRLRRAPTPAAGDYGSSNSS